MNDHSRMAQNLAIRAKRRLNKSTVFLYTQSGEVTSHSSVIAGAGLVRVETSYLGRTSKGFLESCLLVRFQHGCPMWYTLGNGTADGSRTERTVYSVRC